MTLGWRGVMTKYSGFYDLPLHGIKSFGEFSRGCICIHGTQLVVHPVLGNRRFRERAGELNLINLILITLIATIAMHFLLRRKRIRKGGSHATSGWGLGLAVGGMFSIVLIMYKVMAGVNGIADVLTIVLIAFLPLVQRPSSHHTMAFLCCEENDGVQFFVRHSGEPHPLPCFISHGSIFLHGSSSFHQFSWCRNQQKNGCGILFQRRTTTLASYAGRQKEEKQAVQGLFRTPNSIETAEE